MLDFRLGKWIIDKELGRGGMGRVYLAHENAGGQRAAVKVLAAELAKEPGFLERFRREIDALSQLEHPNIVRFYESGEQDNIYYYAMEYVEGRNFEEILSERGRLPWKEVLEMALQVCPALKHAHDRGIVHRDLKPPNLLRTEDGVIKLTDFGIAKVFAHRQLTATGGIVGTAEFLSPEQASGKPATKRSDLYSFGVVLYTLLTGRPPFRSENMLDLLHKHRYAQFDPPQKVVPELPYEIDEVVCQLMEKDPADRPADALVLQRQLERIRAKLERKEHHTVAGARVDQTHAENPVRSPEQEDQPGPATVMSRLMREELQRQKYGGPLARAFNNVWVLLPLFLLCVGVLVWTFWPRATPPAEELFARGKELMASTNPADWDRAWKEDFEPLQRTYPDHPYRQGLEQYRRYVDDRAAQRQALERGKPSEPTSAAQRFYQVGLERCREGDYEGARRTWQNLVRAFGTVPSEQRWVRLAADGLTALNDQVPADPRRDAAFREAVQQVRQLRQSGKEQQAEEVLRGLKALYGDDPSVREALREAEGK